MLLGPSGCGKSTLLKAVAGYIRPEEGEFHLSGRQIKGPGPDRMMVFQEFDQLLPWKSVRDNIMFPLLATGRLTRAQAQERADYYIDKIGLSAFPDAHPHTLSGGMKQRVAIARGMAMEPQILLMDEPFAALDALTRRTMQDELLRLWDETRFTVLFVTHSINEAIKIGNRILLLSPHPGQVRAELESLPRDTGDGDAQVALEHRIHDHVVRMSTTVSPPPGAARPEPRIRPNREYQVIAFTEADAVERPIPAWQRVWNMTWLRKTVLILLLCAIWQLYATYLDNELLFPTFSETMRSFWANIVNGVLPNRAWSSVKVLLMGYAAGVVLATILSVAAINTRIGNDLLETLTSMFNPLPAIALLPLALLWFGLGNGQPGVRAGAFGALGRRAEHACRVPGRVHHPAHGGAQLRAGRHPLRAHHPDPGGVPVHPHRAEGRLGLRLAHADRGGAGVRRGVGRRGPGLVHLREQEPAGDPRRVRRAVQRHPDRAGGGEPGVPLDRAEDRAPLGHAELMAGAAHRPVREVHP